MSRIKTDPIPFKPKWSVGNSERAREDAEAIQKIVRNARSAVRSKPENSIILEVKVVDAVATYFSEPKFSKFSVARECEIQMGPTYYRTDIVLQDAERNFIAIAECKAPGRTNHGTEQLKSYLCATDTRYGILASDTNGDSWIFYENLRRNRFQQIERTDFEERILKSIEI